MRESQQWRPTKYVYRNGRLIGSRDPGQVDIGSRLVADLIAAFYDGAIRPHARGRLLDLGCGSVPLYATYRDFATDTVCVDWANTPHKSVYLDHELDLTQELPFADGQFDTIILSDVLEHIAAPEHLWREMARILSGGGKVLLNVPFYYSIHEAPHDYYRYTEFALRRFVEISGLRLVSLEAIGGTLEVMTDIFAKNVLLLPVVGRPFARFAQWLMLQVRRTRLGRKVAESTGARFPLAYGVIAEKPRCDD